MTELDFIIDYIENRYVSGRRGIGDEEWQQWVEAVGNRADVFFDDYDGYYVYIWKYLGLLQRDSHFAFPDGGMFNREGCFTDDDIILPLWVQTWEDGTVYNVKDYIGRIPKYAEIVCINGYSAKELALRNHAMAPGGHAYAMANMNSYYEPSPLSWPNLANFLFTECIYSPYTVVYRCYGQTETDTVIYNGIRREDKQRAYRRSGDKRRAKEELGFARKPSSYADMGDGVGVLTINSFWGKQWSHMLLFGKDWRYKRLLRQAMRRIDRDGIGRLVIDVSLNTGGMAENVFYTLDYLTDKPVDITYTYPYNERMP